jgi:hypothetical protein
MNPVRGRINRAVTGCSLTVFFYALLKKMDTKPNINSSRRLPRAKGKTTTLLLRGAIANIVLSSIEAWLNLQVKQPILDSDGNVTGYADGQLDITELGSVMTLPGVAANPDESSDVPFSGDGPPGATTLSDQNIYVAGPTPSLYVDMSAFVLWVCTGGGTNSSSVWQPIGVGGMSEYNSGQTYTTGQMVHYTDPTNKISGSYWATAAIAAGTAPGTGAWKNIAYDSQTMQVCDSSGNTSTAQVNSTPPT